MIDRSFCADNRREREHLRSLVERLSNSDMARPCGDGWTVSAQLAHLAFLDWLWLRKFDDWERTGTVKLPENSGEWWDAMIVGMLPWWRNLDFKGVRRDVVNAAEAIDARVETLSETILGQIMELRPRTAIRALHRQDHLAEIDRALAT
jgi:hypothetical protein